MISDLAPRQSLSNRQAHIYALSIAAIAITLGLVLALLPWQWGVTLVSGAGALALSVRYPPVALALALLFGPAKAYTEVFYPSIPDPGQLGLALFLGVWGLQHLGKRRPLPRWRPVAWLLAGWLLMGALSLWGAGDQINGLQELIKWLQILVLALVVADLSIHGQLGWVLAAALLAGVAQAAIGIWQFELRGIGPEHFAIGPGRYRAYGLFEQPNPFGGFMGLVWPLAAGLTLGWLAQLWQPAIRNAQSAIRSMFWLLLCAAVTGLSALALLASYSRGAWLGAAAAGGALLVFWPRSRWVGVGLALAGLSGVLALWQTGLLPASITARLADINDFVQVYDVRGIHINDANFALIERIAHWQAAFNMADAQPWLGVGLGNYDAAYPDFRLINWKEPLGHAHNIYFNTLAETGILGLAAYLTLWLGIGGLTIRALSRHHGWQRGLALGLLGVWAHLTIHQLVDNLYVNNLHLYIGTLLGLLSALLVSAPPKTRVTG